MTVADATMRPNRERATASLQISLSVPDSGAFSMSRGDHVKYAASKAFPLLSSCCPELERGPQDRQLNVYVPAGEIFREPAAEQYVMRGSMLLTCIRFIFRIVNAEVDPLSWSPRI